MTTSNYLPPDPPEFLRSPLNQRNGGGSIDTSMHRCSVLLPLTDEQIEHRISEAEKKEREDDIKARNWAICDAVCSVGFVLAVVWLIGGAK